MGHNTSSCLLLTNWLTENLCTQFLPARNKNKQTLTVIGYGKENSMCSINRLFIIARVVYTVKVTWDKDFLNPFSLNNELTSMWAHWISQTQYITTDIIHAQLSSSLHSSSLLDARTRTPVIKPREGIFNWWSIQCAHPINQKGTKELKAQVLSLMTRVVQ